MDIFQPTPLQSDMQIPTQHEVAITDTIPGRHGPNAAYTILVSQTQHGLHNLSRYKHICTIRETHRSSASPPRLSPTSSQP